MDKGRSRYLPAFKYPWLTSLYDPLIALTMRDTSFKRRLVMQASIQGGQRVLDLGCGTATLTLIAKKMRPDAEVVGVDGDPRVLQIAQAKIANARLEVALNLGMAFDLPYPDGSFDHVLSSLVFHHLTSGDKQRTFQEVSRVLRPGGGLHIVDFGQPGNHLMYLVSQVMRRFEPVSDNLQGILPALMRDAGFAEVRESGRYMTLFGTLSFYQARKPEQCTTLRRDAPLWDSMLNLAACFAFTSHLRYNGEALHKAFLAGATSLVQDTQTIVLYTHPDCDASAQAKADFERDGIAYREIDVTTVPGAIQELERYTGGDHITPVIVDGEMVIVGYGGVG